MSDSVAQWASRILSLDNLFMVCALGIDDRVHISANATAFSSSTVRGV